MEPSELVLDASPESIREHVARAAPGAREAAAGGHDHAGSALAVTVRQATHRGHRIVVRTTYHIEVDGVPVTGHVAVTNDGQVHYHPMPNLSFASAVDLVKGLIDAFPDDFPAPTPRAKGRSEPAADESRPVGEPEHPRSPRRGRRPRKER